ncbi:MAG: hypothetical protein WBG50_15160 [Desulfomonilaceae bacterium]
MLIKKLGFGEDRELRQKLLIRECSEPLYETIGKFTLYPEFSMKVCS